MFLVLALLVVVGLMTTTIIVTLRDGYRRMPARQV